MRLKILLYPVAVLALSGCNILSGRCTYEIRSIEGIGTASEGNVPLASAQVSLSEQRGSIQSQSIYWLVTGDALKGHVTSASFKDAANPSQILLELPLASADRAELTQGAASTGTGDNLGGFHDIIAAGRGIVELQTDTPSHPTLQIVLAATNDGDWIRPYCS